MGIRDRPIAPRSPWQNGHAERLIGSLRRECLDHVVVFGERHLRQLLLAYMEYYNFARTHLSLNNDAPVHGLLRQLGAFTRTQFSANYIISTLGFDLRQGQGSKTTFPTPQKGVEPAAREQLVRTPPVGPFSN
jgi:hypothetical protein